MVREAHELLDGSRPIPIDQITYELSQNIILAFDSNELASRKDTQIEVETRIGLVIDKNKNRIKLPSNTDAIVESNYSDFTSGVDRHSFEYLLNYLHSLEGRERNKWGVSTRVLKGDRGIKGNAPHDGDVPSEKRDSPPGDEEEPVSDRDSYIYEFFSTKKVRSVDKYYVLQRDNSRVRVTTYLNGDSGGESESMAKSLCKRNLNTWNIYMGNNKDYFDEEDEEDDEEDEEDTKGKKKRRTDPGGSASASGSASANGSAGARSGDDSVDYRIAINLEQTKRISKLFLSKIAPVHERVKERTSFINKILGIQLDLTKIKTKEDGELYEIEIEILSKSILKAMSNLRNKNDSNYLLFICSNLVNNARGICRELCHFRKRQTLVKEPGLDAGGEKDIQNMYVHSSRERKNFEKYVHSVAPIVGDYMYRVVARNEERIHAVLREKGFSNKRKIEALQKLIEIRRHNKKSVKKISETYAENRWRVVRTEGAQGQVVLVSEGSDGSDGGDGSDGAGELRCEENVEPTGFNFDNSSASGGEGEGEKGQKDSSQPDGSKYTNFYSDT
ncbi:mRNA capping enzyme [Plasmodium vivax North Korean]|uniref:mRNA 5'-phosphatase n=1 Tax=Plasmodium vivax North Korean TaxID=1035514 RepID=A0A0J9WE35_PLAVI|nr:mRNA capping enzyme [Plasmodium vivax North Korean]